MSLIDTSKQDRQDKKSERKRKRELSDIRFVLKSPEGRRLYWRIMEMGQVFQNPFCLDSTNGTNYNLGRQAISRNFLNDLLEACPDILIQMQQERESEEASERRLEELENKQSGDLV